MDSKLQDNNDNKTYTIKRKTITKMGQYFYNNNNSNNDNNDNVNTILVTILSATKHTDTFFFSETGIITGLKIFYSDLSDVI